MNLLTLLSVFLSDKIYYINGSDSLPPPLPPERETELIELLSSGDESAKNELIEHNLRLVVYIARKFENTGINLEDLISIGTIGLIKAINTFRSDKNIKLATYSSRCIENEILMFLRKNTGIKNEISIEAPLNVDWDGNELLLSDILGTDANEVSKNVETEAEIDQLRKALLCLNDRERQIMSLRFGLIGNKREYTQKEVADMLGISQSYISRLEKKILEKLKDKMTV
ncbi:MAG: RNA polymerase sporulation sigma factor SigE [Ruminococcaceae bacterium]|nr:RNA polymerase sporulation sigma factor SigE [Oscillospiraceae bacterium]